jgi:hypothetical protein
MLVALQVGFGAFIPLNVTVPGVVPKFTPVIVTTVPVGPITGESPVMPGPEPTTKINPLLVAVPTVTVTGPVVAPVGTVAVMLVLIQAVVVAVVPLNFTVPLVPKFKPVIVTDDPTAPFVGLKIKRMGTFPIANWNVLLATPPTVTTTPPDVAPVGTGTVI